MIGGAFKFVLAVVVFIIAGIAINPMLAAVLNGFTLPPLGLFVAQIVCAGMVVASGK
jgi:hypothetical protein